LRTTLWACLCFFAFVLQVGCGGTTSVPPAMPGAPSISPSAAALSLGQSVQFLATFPGNTSSVTWSVNGVPGGNSMVGTIDASGNYTAPSNTQSVAVTITAASGGASPSSLSAQVYVVAPGSVEPTLNPQVAFYTITPPAAANVTIQFGPTTSYGRSTWTQGSPTGGGPVGTYVAGMLMNTAYHMQATVQFPGGVTYTDTDHTFTTGAPPATGLPTITATTTQGMTPQSGVELVDTITPISEVADLAGNILWTYNPGVSVPSGDIVNPIKLLPNGHFLINYSLGAPSGFNSVIQEVDLTGQVYWQMTAAQLNQELATATCSGCNISVLGTHHDFAILPNGHLIVLASTQQMVSGTEVTGDVLIDLDQNHKPVWLWNEFDHLDINRQPYMFPDWTHTNAILYSPNDGDLIISIRHQNWLVKIDYANGAGSGDIVWHLGYQGDFTLLNADGSADTNPFDWFYAQHGPSFTTTNTSGKFSLALFDNGDDRGVSVVPGGTCGVAGQPACYSTVAILNLDETAMTATLAFRVTAADYSFFGGNAEVLKNGNLEYDDCTSGLIYELTQASSPQTVWQMQIAGEGGTYRTMRIPSLYPGVQW
jgi:arylsulfate sulfotransferase